MKESDKRRRGPGALIRTASGFAVVPMLGALTPLLAVPVIAGSFGAKGWAAIAIGQSVGMAGAVVVELGWALSGPQQIARSQPPERPRLFAHAMVTKAIIFLLAAPIVALSAYFLALAYPVASVLAGLAMLGGGLTTNWYFIGLGQPSGLLAFDALPKLVGTLLASAALLTGAALWTYGLIMLIFTIGGVAVAVGRTGEDWRHALNPQRVRHTLRQQRMALGARVASTTYISLSVALVRIVSPTAVAPFAAADRIVRMGLSVLQALPSALQRYLGVAAPGLDTQRRVRRVLLSQLLLGLAAGVVTTLILTPLTELILRGTVEVDDLALPAGFVVALTCASRGSGLALVALNRIGWITASAVVGGSAGAAMILFLGRIYGASGAFWAMAATEACVLAVQCWGLARGAQARERSTDS